MVVECQGSAPKKAFDLVDHNLLVAKLYSLGVKPTVVNLVADFLREISELVKLGSDCFSEFTQSPPGFHRVPALVRGSFWS